MAPARKRKKKLEEELEKKGAAGRKQEPRREEVEKAESALRRKKKSEAGFKTTVETVDGEQVETRIFTKGTPTELLPEAAQELRKKREKRERPQGLENVGEVFKAITKGEKVIANVDNRVFKTGLEYVANNPFATALMITGAAGIIKSATTSAGKATVDGVVRTVGGGGYSTISYAANTKTAKLSATLIGKVLAAGKNPVFVLSAIGAMIGTYPWAEWAAGEAKEIMGFSVTKAVKSEDPALIRETLRQQDEIFDDTVWEQIARLTPGANIFKAFKNKFEALLVQKEINDKILRKELEKLEGGEGTASQEQLDRIEQKRLKKFG